MRETATKLAQSKCPGLFESFADELLHVEDFRGDLCVWIKAPRLKEIVRFLKENPSECFEMLMDLCGMDYEGYPEETPERFAVVYHFYSYSRRVRLRLKVFLPESDPSVDSLTDIYKAANWFEREAWDLFGIRFIGHPHLIRILCHHEFEGHPLRKDYPSDGYQRLKTPLPSEKL